MEEHRKRIDQVSLMFEAARSFLAGAKIIIDSDGIEDDHGALHPTLPVVMCSVFAIELQLKALLFAHGIARPRGDGHDLFVLLNALTPEVQSAVLAYQQTYTDLAPDAARQLLTEEKETFRSWRYPYEFDELATQPAPLFHFALALSNYIKENFEIERSDNGWLRKGGT